MAKDDIQYNNEANKAANGFYGHDILSVGVYNKQKYKVLIAWTDLEVAYTNDYDKQFVSTIIPKGFSVHGFITSLNVISGTGIAYLASTRI